MSDEIKVTISDPIFAYFFESVLSNIGINKVGAGTNMESGYRDLFYSKWDLPINMNDYLPNLIEINPPDIDIK